MAKLVDLIQVRVVAALRRELPEVRDIHGGSRLAADLKLDSLALMELVLALEDRFDVSIPIERVARLHTVDELVAALKVSLARRDERAAA